MIILESCLKKMDSTFWFNIVLYVLCVTSFSQLLTYLISEIKLFYNLEVPQCKLIQLTHF